MKYLLNALLIFFALPSFAQDTLLHENFSGGIPQSWNVNAGSGPGWSISDSLGADSGACAISDHGSASTPANSWLQTAVVDLSSASNPTIQFSAARVQNNFVPPGISLWYNVGNGWVQTSWSSISVTSSFNNRIPLERANITWTTVIYDLSSLPLNNPIRFSFGADFVNGGWVLIDDLVIADNTPTQITKVDPSKHFDIFPNPGSGSIVLNSESLINRIEVTTTQGKVVLSQFTGISRGSFQLDFSHLPLGVYLINVETAEGQKLIRKFILK